MTVLLLIAGTVRLGLWLLYTELVTPGPSRFTTAIRRYHSTGEWWVLRLHHPWRRCRRRPDETTFLAGPTDTADALDHLAVTFANRGPMPEPTEPTPLRSLLPCVLALLHADAPDTAPANARPQRPAGSLREARAPQRGDTAGANRGEEEDGPHIGSR